MRREAPGEQRTQTPARSGLLDMLTSGIGTAWALLAAVRFLAGLLMPQAEGMDFLRLYYLVLALALAHLVDGVRFRQTAPRS